MSDQGAAPDLPVNPCHETWYMAMKDLSGIGWVGFLLTVYFLPEVEYRGLIIWTALIGGLIVPAFVVAKKMFCFGPINKKFEERTLGQVTVDFLWRIVVFAISILTIRFMVEGKAAFEPSNTNMIIVYLSHILMAILLVSVMRFNYKKGDS
ncbi:MAG: hypothetical protein ABW066_08305 [Sedimenticola sp.]